jgi:hypothetical protein
MEIVGKCLWVQVLGYFVWKSDGGTTVPPVCRRLHSGFYAAFLGLFLLHVVTGWVVLMW